MDNEKFGEFFQKQRAKAGLTQEQTGNILSVTDKAVSRWERGECYPEITQLPKIAELFSISVDEIINARENPKRLLKMCDGCNNKKCKQANYSQLNYCARSFHWVVYGICACVLLVLMCAIYLITKIATNNWGDWKMPIVMGIIYIAVVFIGALIFSLTDAKAELKTGTDGEMPD